MNGRQAGSCFVCLQETQTEIDSVRQYPAGLVGLFSTMPPPRSYVSKAFLALWTSYAGCSGGAKLTISVAKGEEVVFANPLRRKGKLDPQHSDSQMGYCNPKSYL